MTRSKVRASAVYGAAPRPAPWAGAAHNWMVELRYRGRRMRVPFYAGLLVGRVSAADVLECVLSDALSAETATFDEWCADFGMSDDSIAAWRTYEQCVKTGKRVRAFLGDEVYAEAIRDPQAWCRRHADREEAK